MDREFGAGSRRDYRRLLMRASLHERDDVCALMWLCCQLVSTRPMLLVMSNAKTGFITVTNLSRGSRQRLRKGKSFAKMTFFPIATSGEVEGFGPLPLIRSAEPPRIQPPPTEYGKVFELPPL